MSHKITTAFPWIVSTFSLMSLVYPSLFTWFQGALITLGLGAIMLAMGLTLQGANFLQIIQNPKWVLLGLGMQFMIMPLLGWGLAQLFHLDSFFAVGMILVACCPGGTASNVIAYLANAKVALSITITACSTLASIMLTPFLTLHLSGNYLEIPAEGHFLSTLKVILLPIALGIFINKYLPKAADKIIPFAPPAAVLLICLIVASIVGQGKEIILSSGIELILALICLHLIGFVLGFFLSLGLLKNWRVAKTIAIEVGMQNSGLGVVLACENFNSPIVAIPAAISSLIHSLLGSFFVKIFKNKN